MRIVIVEDEVQIRNGIKNLVERINSEYRVVGCAGNGVHGLNMVKEQLPDVVITDVRMPEMDGIEMIGALCAAGIPTKYIIISAYSEFSYAKQAISLGVTEYLLKPISIADLTECLTKAEMQIQAFAQRSNMDTLESALRMLVLRGDSVSWETLNQISSKYQLDRDSMFIQVLFYYGDRYSTARDTVSRMTCKKLMEECTLVCSIPLERQKAFLYILIGVDDPESFSTWLSSCIKIYSQTMWYGASVSLAYCYGLDSVYGTAMELLHTLNWRIALPKVPLIRYPEVLQITTQHCAFPIEIENQLRIAICSQNIEKTQQQLNGFKRYFSGEKVYAPQDIKECYTRFLWTASTLAKEVGLLPAENMTVKPIIEGVLAAQTLAELNAVAVKLFDELCSAPAVSDQDDHSITVLRAKSLIHEFYSTGITLEEIAQKLNITPEYLSTQFRKETGETFSVYIRNYRITKAKELLIGTQLKLHQIATQVGYTDPKYFGQVFKKCTGQLPAEYRRSKK